MMEVNQMESLEDLLIVQAEEEDLKRLKEIWLEFVEYHTKMDSRFRLYSEDWPHVMENFSRSLHDEESRLFVAKTSRKLVGYIYGFIFHNKPGYYPKRVGFIRDAVVLESFQRQGIGKSLVKHMEDWFRTRELDVAQLYAAYENRAGIAAWKGLGYEDYVVGMWKQLT